MTLKPYPQMEYQIKNIFIEKSCKKCAAKVNNPKQPLHATNDFKSNIF